MLSKKITKLLLTIASLCIINNNHRAHAYHHLQRRSTFPDQIRETIAQVHDTIESKLLTEAKRIHGSEHQRKYGLPLTSIYIRSFNAQEDIAIDGLAGKFGKCHVVYNPILPKCQGPQNKGDIQKFNQDYKPRSIALPTHFQKIIQNVASKNINELVKLTDAANIYELAATPYMERTTLILINEYKRVNSNAGVVVRAAISGVKTLARIANEKLTFDNNLAKKIQSQDFQSILAMEKLVNIDFAKSDQAAIATDMLTAMMRLEAFYTANKRYFNSIFEAWRQLLEAMDGPVLALNKFFTSEAVVKSKSPDVQKDVNGWKVWANRWENDNMAIRQFAGASKFESAEVTYKNMLKAIKLYAERMAVIKKDLARKPNTPVLANYL